jgi:hypothetical protein
MRPLPVAVFVAIALIPFTGCTDPSPSSPLSNAPTRGVSADVVGGTTITVAFSSFGSGQVFDPTFFDASGIDFPPQQCDPSGCHTWFVGFIQGSPALGGGVVSATFTHPVSDLSLLVAPALQGTATYTLKAFDASRSLLASTSVTVTQDQGDPATIAYGYFPIALATLPAPATSFTLDNVLVRSSFPNTVGAIPYGVSTISFTPAASTPPAATFLAAPDLDAAVLTSTVIEGTAIKLALVNPSPAGGTFTYAFDCGSGFGPFGSTNRAACPTVDNGVRTVRGQIHDANGTVTGYSTVVTIVNQKPHVVLTTAQGSTSTLGSPRTVSGTFTDPGLLDAPWTWVIQWGDGSSSNGSSSTQGGAIPASHAYTRAGTFKISMTVTDKDGGTGKSNSVSVQVLSDCFPSLPAPQLVLASITQQGFFNYYNLNVLNASSFPDALFAPAPALPPCGTNTNSSRTWVDIFSGDGTRINGFCGLRSANDMNFMWFAVPLGQSPPAQVYIVLTDRQCGISYRSNEISLSP